MGIFSLFSKESQFTTGLDINDPTTQRLLRSIQGNILKPHGRDNANHVFVTFNGGPSAARSWVRQAGESVTSAWAQHEQSQRFKATCAGGVPSDGGTFVGLFVSADGYVALGLPAQRFESSFRKGMKSRDGTVLTLAKQIISVDNKDPEPGTWQADYRHAIHLMLLLADDNLSRLEAQTAVVIASLKGIATTFVEPGARIMLPVVPPNACKKGKDLEHFGYRDGISQPLFFADDIQEKLGQADPAVGHRYDPSAPTELVLARDPFGATEHALGSYLVFRKLAQDVDGFHKAVAELAGTVNDGDQALTGAQVIGRFKDGTPVTDFDRPQGLNADVNNFNYDGDEHTDEDEGQRCPLHAHIRKTNPRNNTPLTSHESERSRRIARRGMPYGKPGDPEVGLLFMCFQHDIHHQFEFIQRVWVDNSRFPQLVRGTGDDPLIGQDETHAEQRWGEVWDQEEPKHEVDFKSHVKLRGGEYFFAPSLSFFENV